MSRLLGKTIPVGLLVAVVFTALALGTVEAWSVAIFEVIIVVLLLLWATKAITEKRLEINVPSAALPLGAFLLLGLAQSVAVTGSADKIQSLSMDVEATRGAVTVIFFLFVCFVIAANFFGTREQLRALASFLIIYGLVLAVFALVQQFTWDGRLFWLRPTPAAGAGQGGPFVNRNHFAGYMEMLIPIPIALALSRSTRLEARLFYGFAAAIMGIALLASLSRGGMVSLAASLLFIAALSARRRRDTTVFRPASLILLILVALAAGVIWIGADFDILRRMTNDPLAGDAAMGRQAVWGDTLRMFLAHPILGVGLGAFETVYPIYGRGDGSFLIQFSHNDYLQVLSDVGIVGGVIALWFIVVIARSAARAVKSPDPLLRALGLGSAAGIFALLVHSGFDFNLQIPSNALLFLLLSAMVSRASVSVNAREIEVSRRARVDRPAVVAAG